MPSFGFVGASYTSESGIADAERSVNLYCQAMESATGETKAALILVSTPGLGLFAPVPYAASIQATYATPDGRAFLIDDRAFLWEVFADASLTQRGTLTPAQATGFSLAASSTQLLIVNGGDGFVFDLEANTLTPIRADGWRGGTSCCYIDGYFLCLEPDSQTFTISALKDGTAWDALDFGAAQSAAGNVRVLFADHRSLWLMASDHADCFYDSGNADFPWTRNESIYMEQGIAAPRSLAKADNAFFWLGNDALGAGMVWRNAGSTPVRVSNHAIEKAIQSYSRIDDACAYTYQLKGHTFYKLHFPTAGATWVYDCATGFWHEHLSWDSVNGQYIEHRGRTHMFAFGKHLVGDWQSGNLYEMHPRFVTEAGSPVRWLRIAPHVANELKWIRYEKLRLDCQVALGHDGDTTGLGAPTLSIRLSRDGGMTWGPERTTTLGAIGQTRARVEFRRLGRARDLVVQAYGSYPAPMVIVNAYLGFTPEAH